MYPDSEWRQVWKFVIAKFDYAIIPLVLTELILGIAGGDEEHFEENRRAVKILYPTHKKRFLWAPGLFVTQTVLGRRPTGDFLSPDTYRNEARTLMRAQSKRSLMMGRVQMPESRKYSHGMDFSVLRAQMEHGQRDHVSTLQQLRAGHLAVPSAPDWAKGWMLTLGFEATPEECARVAGALDAAYRYECFLWNEAMHGQYDFSKHKSDWIDSQLLYYLADPTVHILVHDRKLKQRIAGSTQSDRVFDYADFLALAMSGPASLSSSSKATI
jgi:hypothetical protein